MFYGLRETARFITTRKLKYKISNRILTIPKGFVADGFQSDEQDFCTQPNWIAFEWLYCNHKFDHCQAERSQIDVFMFNSYPDQIKVVEDELIMNDVRISGDDIYQEAMQRGFAICPEIVEEVESYSSPFEYRKEEFIQLAVMSAFALCGYFIADALSK